MVSASGGTVLSSPCNELVSEQQQCCPGRSISTQLPQTLLIDSVDREISQWARFIDRVVDTRSTKTVTSVQTVGNTEEIPQVQSFDKVDMAFAVRDQSRQRRTLLMFRMFSFLIE